VSVLIHLWCENRSGVEMRMVGERSAVRKLVEIANAVDAVQDGRIFVELVNRPFLDASGTPINAASHWRATAPGWLSRHESGTYVNFTPAGAEMFA
jgi:hypothetical protein